VTDQCRTVHVRTLDHALLPTVIAALETAAVAAAAAAVKVSVPAVVVTQGSMSVTASVLPLAGRCQSMRQRCCYRLYT
jgi:hypothetical protein